ncbi:imelysin family protein [Phaeovulum sp. W22_SRMD_FR3]|uniref:imelysin family protein n=1 Tax=Phaeovulum sp. W22_SRMD_FR3 TaxID=3240274 RepID=UPI003F96BF15
MTRCLTALVATTALCASPAFADLREDVLANYAEIGAATYGDAAVTAHALQAAVDAFLAAPSEAGLEAARDAWKAARAPYMQSEVFRFGNPVVDAWEGQVNAWPLDEGLIDYVDADSAAVNEENDYALLNVVANPQITIAGTAVDASQITPALIADVLQEADGIEANVASGYHAVEFLLWGQDLNGTGPGAGARAYTDYVTGDACTNGNCDRRAAYLKSVTDLLVTDLDEMAADWQPGGAARAAITDDTATGIAAILTGLGSLSYGELAGERMKLGLMLHDPEEEQDCFSDNTYNSHYYDGIGMQNVLTGRYNRVDGSVVQGASLQSLVAEKDPALAEELTAKIGTSVAALTALKEKAEGGMAYDQMLATGNAEGGALIQASVDALIDQTRSIERAVKVLGADASIEGSDSLDAPTTVFQ